jgi:integrase
MNSFAMDAETETAGIGMKNLIRRGDAFHLRRRVPKRYERIEPRGHVWLTLKTDSESDAARKAGEVWDQMVEGWEATLAGHTETGIARYQAARDLAHSRGFRFLPARRVAELPIDDLLDRVKAATGTTGHLDKFKAAAFLGATERPPITVSEAERLYYELSRELTRGKSEDQARRWKNPRKKAVKNFIAVVGNPPIEEISADDMLNFRNWWDERIENEGLSPNSANKDFVHFCGMIRFVNKRKQLGIAFPFSDLHFKEVRQQRIPFSDGWIRENIIRHRNLGGLNTEARAILLGMVNTGYRPSEPANLGADQIHLDCDFPHISIEPIGRTLKTAHSARIIPLVGVSLEAFKLCPKGFPRYFNSSSLSNVINKFMRENGMMESEDHSLYGLRHSFEDRMLAAGIDERIRRDLMGHALNRERYGKGATLEHVHTALQAIAL